MSAVPRDVFLQRRLSGIGGSDVSALLGLNKYTTQYELWLKKTGRFEENLDEDQAERMDWGNTLEDVVAKKYAQRSGVKIQRINSQIVHPSCEIAIGNLDRVVLLPKTLARWDGERIKGAEKVLEVKTASAFTENGCEWGEPGTDKVPIHYFLQVRWYMGIAKLEQADIAVLFGGQKLKTYTVHHDQGFFDDLLNEAGEWWEKHVKADTPPEPINAADARSRWKRHASERQVVLDDAMAKKAAEFKELNKKIKALETKKDAILDEILPVVADAELILHGGDVLATYRNNKDSVKIDWEAAFEELLDSEIHPDFHEDLRSQLTKAHQVTKAGARVLRWK